MGIGKRKGVEVLLIYIIEKELKTLEVLDLHLQFRMLRCLCGRLLSMFHSPSAHSGSETSRLGRKPGSLLSHLPTLA